MWVIVRLATRIPSNDPLMGHGLCPLTASGAVAVLAAACARGQRPIDPAEWLDALKRHYRAAALPPHV